MVEGLHLSKQTGAIVAFVGSYEPAAHAFYASVDFKEYDLSQAWGKQLCADQK